MKCKSCGKNNPINVNKCLYCGASLNGGHVHGQGIKKPSQQTGNADRIILAAIIVLTVIFIGITSFVIYQSMTPSYGSGFKSGGGGGGGGYYVSNADNQVPDLPDEDVQTVLDRIAEINGGVLPELTYDETGVISFIDGKYTNRKVTSYETAIQSLIDIRPLMQIGNPMSEYKGLEMYKMDTYQFYKLQQVVNSVPVYNRECIVETDSEGGVVGLMCDYDPGIDINTTPTISKNQAAEIARQMSYGDVIYNNLLYVFNDNETPVLAWGIDVGDNTMTNGKVFISAVDGSVVSAFSAAEDAGVIEAGGMDMKNRERTFNVTHNGTNYIMKDETRGITVYDFENNCVGDEVTSRSNTWTNAAAVSAIGDVSQVIDYYTNVLKTNAFIGGKLRNINVYVNYKPIDCLRDVWNNASSQTSADKKTVIIRYGQGHSKSLDVTAHEFTHSVIRATCNLNYMNESGALNEAYADIIGNIIQNNIYDTNEWEIAEELDTGAIRDMADPTRFGQPDHIDSEYKHAYCYQNHDHGDADCDGGGVHTNSGIINRAAYLMYEKGINNKLELANIFCRSMNYMHSNPTFKVCRAALIHAAREMNLSTDKQRIISDAFAEVGIVNAPIAMINPDEPRGFVSGVVADAFTGNALYNVMIGATRLEDEDNPITYASCRSDENGNFSMELPEGQYRLTVSAEGYLTCRIENIQITAEETTYLEHTILLTASGDNDSISRAAGVVTNAVSGDPVQGVVIKFRQGWGERTGQYVQNELGNDIFLVTNESGEYYTSELRYSYYTAEVVKEGFATQYVNIISAPNEAALNQDIVLSPIASGNNYRITLEWDANPRDEDAHIVGDFQGNGDFHVYFGHKNAEINGETVANLDHDDTHGNGFETVTLTVDPSAVYQYYVHHYAGSGYLLTSNAKVKVYRGDVMIKQFNVPTDQGEGRYWNVFNIINGEITAINEITNEPQ